MIGPYDWYYLVTGKKKHVVQLTAFADFPMQSAACGCQVLAALPREARWQADPAVLAQREPCKQCIAILEREPNVQGR
jgi:hypothetical protein